VNKTLTRLLQQKVTWNHLRAKRERFHVIHTGAFIYAGNDLLSRRLSFRVWVSLRPQERQCGLGELRCGVEEDRAVTAIGHHPKCGAGNGAVHVNRHLHRIEKTVASSQLSVVSEDNRKRKRPHVVHVRPLFMSATTYSPTHFRVQYNRPSGA